MWSNHLFGAFTCTRTSVSARGLHVLKDHPCPKIWTSGEVRNAFVDYFKGKEHTFVKSSPVLSVRDPSLLFVNAGMNQFKPIILAQDLNDSVNQHLIGLTKVVNFQKCIRLSGKHNDLDEVGHNFRHHTFFEMLGNWAFNNAYFKKEACTMALDLLVNVFGMHTDRLLFTYFGGDAQLGLPEDAQSKHIWLDLGIQPQRIISLGAKDNFWEMGDQGPCGGCTEIHFILNEQDAKTFSQQLQSKPSADRLQQLQKQTLDQSLEIWNLVFMQYDRKQDGRLEALPTVHVDTGMGLERMLSVLNGRHSNYDTDLFKDLFRTIHEHTHYEGNAPYRGSRTDPVDIAYRIIADHVRAIVVAVGDGCVPAKQDAGFCMRKLIRKVHVLLRLSFGQKSSAHLFKHLIAQVVDSLGHHYPELVRNREHIEHVVLDEISLFRDKMKAARHTLKKVAAAAAAAAEPEDGLRTHRVLSGLDTLKLQKRYGVPKEWIEHLATQYSLQVDWKEFDRLIHEDHVRSLQGHASSSVPHNG